MVIYQILPRLYGNLKESVKPCGGLAENGCGRFSDIDVATLKYLKWLGCSHIYLTGILSHSTRENIKGCTASHPSIVKGMAGSPYAIKDHYDLAPYLADNPASRMQEFEALVGRIHDQGLKVIIDFVPNHVARDYGIDSYSGPNGMKLGENDDVSVHWRAENDFYYYPGQYLSMPQSPDAETPYIEYPAKASGNNFSASIGVNDWYDTIRINYCDFYTETWDKMFSVLRFWASKGVDGFRCDMAELVPKEFMKWAISRLKNKYPDIIFIGEVYQKSLYQTYIREVGFDFLYDKSGTYDINRNILTASINAETDIPTFKSAQSLTYNWQNLSTLQPYMLNFIENHDEQRSASSFFLSDALKAKPALWFDLFFNRAPFMIYFGEELGEKGEDAEGFSTLDGRTTIFDWWTTPALKDLWELIHSEAYLKDELPGRFALYEPVFRMYAEALQMKNDNLIEESLTYDLNYCNYTSAGFDKDRHFAFLKANKDEIHLFVCNFSNADCEMDIYIPQHAFDYVPIAVSEELNSQKPIHIKVSAFDAKSVRLK